MIRYRDEDVNIWKKNTLRESLIGHLYLHRFEHTQSHSADNANREVATKTRSKIKALMENVLKGEV
jgi:hypothetical protein